MGFFKKKKKPTIIQITCPNCGKTHDIVFQQVTAYYLDGVPQDLRAALTQYVICDCGCLCHRNMDALPDISTIIASDNYQMFLHGDYEEEERKLCLMQLLYWSHVRPEAWIIHAVDDELYPAALQRAINIALDATEDIKPMEIGEIFPAPYFPALQTTGRLDLTQNLYLADLYRQAQDWINASKYLDAEEKQFVHKEGATWRYLQKQRELIAAHNSEIM